MTSHVWALRDQLLLFFWEYIQIKRNKKCAFYLCSCEEKDSTLGVID